MHVEQMPEIMLFKNKGKNSKEQFSILFSMHVEQTPEVIFREEEEIC
jgi:hypothetical protein